MRENNIQTSMTFLLYLYIILIITILISRKSYCKTDYRYDACVPKNCGNGPNISFPFYISGLQEPYCGYPGFKLNCSRVHNFPIIEFPEIDYAVEDIFYGTRTLRVYNPAVLSQNDTVCLPRIRNTSIPTTQFEFADNVTGLHLFSHCNNNNIDYNKNNSLPICGANPGDSWDLALLARNTNFTSALQNCEGNIVAPVEIGDGEIGLENLLQVLRKGFVLNWKASLCGKCQRSGGRCGFNATTYHFRCFCRDRPQVRTCIPEKGRTTSLILIIATAVSGGGVFIFCLLIPFIIWKCKKRIKNHSVLSRNKSLDPSSKSDIEGGSYFGIPVFCYSELEAATNRFDSSNELGDGGFGTVYYGKLQDGREVAIKRHYKHDCRTMEQFINEIKLITCLRHKNLVSLYGCTSRRSKELLLVYEYIPNGTVADHLHGKKVNESPLTWPVRMAVAIETASALSYLHKSGIIHRDVKTDNILLDDNFRVKVADFGLSRVFPNKATHVSTGPQGTPGYVDPEYHRCYRLTDKSDVYSFGVVLAELVSSMRAVDVNRDEINLATLVVDRIQRRAFDEIIDSSLGYECDEGVRRMMNSVAELAFRCLGLEREMRPSMDEVLEILEGIKKGGGDQELEFEKSKGADCNYFVAGKDESFGLSPNAVTDVWVSSASTSGSVE
ncbi:probable serine/threonine-protein kinase at1g18390 [Phtheirospermum japonicum]|uniref:non-specific serine/threonine protein kinase n=1 Tax=Phtheirospermum japonicum TaxID=374723 RepID=A0A830BH10_9LAMI|nr:probable serine/threonine-protein kinase at1g18390 [Phtheirospermum japonicum]